MADYPLIADHGLIGDLQTAALVATDGFSQEREGGRRGGRQFGGQFGGGQFGGSNKSRLLRSEQVQTELKLTDEQKSKINAILEESRPQGREGFGGNREEFRNLSQEERQKRFQEMAETARKRNAEVEQKLEGALDVDQVKRMNEISIQQRGLGALSDDEVAADLKLTDAQKTKIREINEANREKMREMFTGGRGQGGEDNRARFQELRTNTEKQIMDVLTAEQKQAFADMKGSAFELERRGFQGRTGGDRRRGGDRNRSGNQN